MSKRTQRRLTTIVAADIAGFSRLVGADEEGTLAAQRAHRTELIEPLLAEHHGRIANTAGDSFLFEFPSAVEAVRCSIAMQDGIAGRNRDIAADQRIEYRIGINVGDVMADGADLLGDGVNIAARLENLCTPGGIILSDDAYRQVRDRLDVSWEDGGEHEVKNIARPVTVWRWSAAVSPTVAPTAVDTPLPLPDKPSIAVLPFNNMSGEPEQEYFADGMTEDIITELSRFENLFVIARNTSFTFKGQRVDVKDVAQELGVHFILEGSVRKAGQRVRITAQLINGQDGGHLWAERYDGALEDVFDLQEQVTSQVVGSISPQISQAELRRIGKGERIFDEAHELAWQAMKTWRSGQRLADPSMIERAIVTATDSVKMNAECGMAYQTLCMALMSQSLYRWGDDPAASADLAEDWAKKFISQVPNSYMAFNCLGIARFRKGQYQLANLDFQHAHELNANDAAVLRFWAWCEASTGEFEEAKKHAHMAIRLSPKDLQVGLAYLALAMAAFIEKDTVEFEDWAGKAIQSQPNAPIRRAMMIAYAAETGNQALLETHRTELMRVAPDFIDSLFRDENKLFQQPEHMAMLLDGLRKAGFSV